MPRPASALGCAPKPDLIMSRAWLLLPPSRKTYCKSSSTMFDDAATAFVEQSLGTLRINQVLDILDSACAIEQAMLPRVHDHGPQITIDYKDRNVSEGYATRL